MRIGVIAAKILSIGHIAGGNIIVRLGYRSAGPKLAYSGAVIRLSGICVVICVINTRLLSWRERGDKGTWVCAINLVRPLGRGFRTSIHSIIASHYLGRYGNLLRGL